MRRRKRECDCGQSGGAIAGVMRWRRTFAAAAAAASLAFGGVAAAEGKKGQQWRHEAALSLTVHEHSFRRAVASASSCEVEVRLHFDAPATAYAEPVSERNHYRFVAQIKLSGGKSFLSPVLSNSKPGPRVISFRHDSGGQGCWAESRRKLRKVDVRACRGEGCTPRAF